MEQPNISTFSQKPTAAGHFARALVDAMGLSERLITRIVLDIKVGEPITATITEQVGPGNVQNVLELFQGQRLV